MELAIKPGVFRLHEGLIYTEMQEIRVGLMVIVVTTE